ncbi:MAG TPA: RNA methyltransferase [Streptosporangiaceae bacterium]|nr:RNA methyltransferase [Streptosporangiaceae bacterium]
MLNARSSRVKAARLLARRSMRERSRLFLAEGPQAVREALGGRQAAERSLVTELFVTGLARTRHEELVEAVAVVGAPIYEIDEALMAELAQTVTPQGLLAVCPFIDVPLADLVAGSPRLVVILANVRDPGNAGTVLRTADAAGADAVIFAGDSVDPYNSKCVRACTGSLFHLPFATGVPVAETIAGLHEISLAVLAADGSATVRLDQLEAAGRLGRPTAWMFGNEAWGLPADLLALADEAVAVPIYGRAESLNLAAAAAVCLYASARSHQGGVPDGSSNTLGFGYVAS